MKPVVAIVEPAAVDLDAIRKHLRVEFAGERDDIRIAERHEKERDRHASAAEDARESARQRRLRIGGWLAKARAAYPARGPAPAGTPNWTDFLGEFHIDDATARRYMDEYRDPEGFAQRASAERNPARGDRDSEPDNDNAERPKGNRDAWCTPEWLTRLLPFVDLDPCSNPRSTVRAHKTYSLEAGQDGLVLPWFGLVFVNGPYSKLLPWAEKLAAEGAVTGAGFLVNADHSPGWWHVLKNRLRLRFDFDDRLEFDPPPGIESSRNDKPQSLLMDDAFWTKCRQSDLRALGTLWRQEI